MTGTQAHTTIPAAPVGRPVIALPTSGAERRDAVVRVTAADLREAGVLANRIRQDHPAGTPVLLDVDVHLAADSRTALREAAALDADPSDRIRYVGTPAGLAGLVADIRAAGIADGIVALAIGGRPELGVVVRESVAPLLECEVADVA